MVKEIDLFQPQDGSEVLTAFRAVEDYTNDTRLAEILLTLAQSAMYLDELPKYSFSVMQSHLVMSALHDRATQVTDSFDKANANYMLGNIVDECLSLVQQATRNIPDKDDYPTGYSIADATVLKYQLLSDVA